MAQRLPPRARLGAPPSVAHADRHARHRRAQREALLLVPKGFFPQQDTGRLAGGIQAAQDISFQSMSDKLAQVVDDDLARPERRERPRIHRRRRRRRRRAVNTGRIFVDAQASPDERTLTSDEVLGTAPRAARRRFPARRRSCSRCRISASAADRATRSTSTRCRRGSRGRAGRRRQQGAGEDPQHAAARRRQHRPAGPRPRGDRWWSTATPRRASASRRSSSTTRSTTRSASARSRSPTRR